MKNNKDYLVPKQPSIRQIMKDQKQSISVHLTRQKGHQDLSVWYITESEDLSRDTKSLESATSIFLPFDWEFNEDMTRVSSAKETIFLKSVSPIERATPDMDLGLHLVEIVNRVVLAKTLIENKFPAIDKRQTYHF